MRCPVLVGRDGETAVMRQALAAVQDRRGGTLLVVGDAGVGKSRLAAEAVALAHDHELTVLAGRAAQAEHPATLRPVAEAVISAVRVSGQPEHPDLAPFRPTLGRLVPQWRSEVSAPGDATAPAVALGEAVLCLARVLGRRGSLLILEDLHWADPDTLAVVEYLADNLAREPTLLVATMRPEGPAARLAESLRARGAADVVTLDRLEAAEVAVMVHACLDDEQVPAEVDAFIESRSDGLPLLVEELLTGLADTGSLLRVDGRWVARSRLAPRVPLTFAETVSRRLGGLEPEQRHVVDAAAVSGRRFDWTLLGPALGMDRAAVLAALRRSVEVGLVVAESAQPCGFGFRHALTRDAVLAELLPPEQAILAEELADALEEADPELAGERVDLAAELRERAGQPGRAAELLLRSARRALATGALAGAESTVHRARSLVGAEPSVLVALDETLLDVLVTAGRVDEVADLGEVLLGRLTESGASSERVARVRLQLARAAVTGGRSAEAMTQLDATGAAVDAATVDALRAQIALGAGQVADAIALAQRAVPVAEAARQHEVACEALEVIGRAARLQDLAQAEAAFERAYRIAEEHNLGAWRIRALHELGTIDLLDRIRGERLEAAREAAVAAGALATAAHLDLQIGVVPFCHFDTDTLQKVALRCVELSRRLRLPALPKALLGVATAHAMEGRRDEMEALIQEAYAAAPDDPEVEAAAWGEVRSCYWQLQADDAAAVDAFDRGAAIYREHPALPFPYWGRRALLHTVLGDGQAARQEAREHGQRGFRNSRCDLRYAEAVAHGRRGEADAAATAFADAEASGPGHWGPTWWDYHNRRLVARAALTDGWGDPVAWLRDAIGWFERHGQVKALAASRALLRQAGVTVPRRGRGDAMVPDELRALGVTSREMDVLLLVARGLSNAEIARELHLSPRTVEKHVTSLLMRTDARSRTQLAARFAGSRS